MFRVYSHFFFADGPTFRATLNKKTLKIFFTNLAYSNVTGGNHGKSQDS